MKILFDFLPVLLFFVVFKYAEGHEEWAADVATSHFGGIIAGGVVGPGKAPVLLATVVMIIATVAHVAWLKLRNRRVNTMLWVILMLVVVLGGTTVYFHDETFVKWKPSALYWAMGLSLWLSPLMLGKNLLRWLLGEQMRLPSVVWHRLNFAWVAFFASMGLLNLWVAYSFSMNAWVNFKLFGGIGLMLLFTLAQALCLNRHLKDDVGDAVKAPADST